MKWGYTGSMGLVPLSNIGILPLPPSKGGLWLRAFLKLKYSTTNIYYLILFWGYNSFINYWINTII